GKRSSGSVPLPVRSSCLFGEIVYFFLEPPSQGLVDWVAQLLKVRFKLLLDRFVEQASIQNMAIFFFFNNSVGWLVSPDDPLSCFGLVKNSVPDALHKKASDFAVECTVKGGALEKISELLICTTWLLYAV